MGKFGRCTCTWLDMLRLYSLVAWSMVSVSLLEGRKQRREISCEPKLSRRQCREGEGVGKDFQYVLFIIVFVTSPNYNGVGTKTKYRTLPWSWRVILDESKTTGCGEQTNCDKNVTSQGEILGVITCTCSTTTSQASSSRVQTMLTRTLGYCLMRWINVRFFNA